MLFLYNGNLNKLDMLIAKKIENKPQIIIDNNIYGAANEIGISASKLTKYCQKIKLAGFKEMKYKLNQELNYKVELKRRELNYSLKNIIDTNYYTLANEVRELIRDKNKLIIISNSEKFMLNLYLSQKMRMDLNIDIVSYVDTQNFNFEYLGDKPITLIIDEKNEIDICLASWYHIGLNYIHLTSQALAPTSGYLPLCLRTKVQIYNFDILIMLVIQWVTS